VFGELEEIADFEGQCGADLAGADKEELFARIGVVQALCGEVLVQFCLEADRVFREEQRMHIEAKRHGRAAEFVDALNRL